MSEPARIPAYVVAFMDGKVGEDEYFTDYPALAPMIYADGTAELKIEIPGQSVYVQFSVADLVRFATIAERTDNG